MMSGSMARRTNVRSCLLGVSLTRGLTIFRLVETNDNLFADWVRLKNDVVAYPIIMRESGSDVEPVVILLGTLHDRVDPVHFLGLLCHDAPPLNRVGFDAERIVALGWNYA